MLDQHSVLTFEGDQAPPHLYFVVDTPSIDDHNAQVEFMAQMDWPFKLSVARVEYTLISRGFWGRKHYWGKVLRHVNGVTGVWLHDDRENKGYARLVNRVPGSIGGPQPDTSWLIYSRRWTPDESEFMAQSIEKIRRDNPRFQENLPFVKMAEVLNISPYADEPHVAGPSASAPVISVSTNTLFDFNEGTGQAMAATQPPQTTDPASGASLKIRIRLPKEAATGPNKFESNLPSLKPALLIHELQPGSLHQTTPNEPKLTHPSCQKRKAESDLQRDDEAFQPVGVQTRSKSKITRDTQPTSLASTTLTHDSGSQICIARPSNVAAALPSPSATLTHNSGSQICSAGPSTALGCSDAALFSLESTAEEKAENIAYWKRFEERQQEYALEDAQLDAIAAEFEDWNTRMEASIARTRAIRARRPRGKRPKKTMFLSGLFDPAI
ncbi:hypothetical protein PSTG_00938 [Puccinia striiformis f. sp. tritici PST-78]|uniref:Uncharacterized protein n=3 Tax=Puccinia striiformis TaxID=27350 RepID=A0A0L0W360_9BASI|nr:hypothetical protein PSTG_00938 [Puccinia striiformis f. sp. tritici PST-78]